MHIYHGSHAVLLLTARSFPAAVTLELEIGRTGAKTMLVRWEPFAMRLFGQGLRLVAVPLAVNSVVTIALVMHLSSLEQAIQEQAQFAKLSGTLTKTNAKIQEAMFQAGFYAIDKDKKYTDAMKTGILDVEKSIMQTRKIILADPQLAPMQPQMDENWDVIRKALLGLEDKSGAGIAPRAKEEKLLIVALIQEKTTDTRHLMESALRNMQDRALDAASRAEESRLALRVTLLVGFAMNVAVGIGLLLVFSRDTTSRIKRITENSIRLARGEELEPQIGGTDEIATLDDIFHQVANALQVSATRERAVFENAVDVIASLDGDGRIMRINKAFTDLTDYDVEDAMENHVMEYVAKNDQGVAYDFLMNAKKEPDTSHKLEVGMRTRGGEIRDALWSIKWDSEEKSYFLVAHDVTERKELERAKQEFVNMVSHDLRSPLTSLRVTLDMFLQGVFGEQTSKGTLRLQSMDESIGRLIRLINDLLDIEKLQAGQMQLAIQPTSSKFIVDTAVETVRGMALAQKIELKATPQDISVTADGDRVVQVLVNLISNAIKFSSHNTVVEVTSRVVDGVAEFRVIDQGRGIPADKLGQVFERFKQVDAQNAAEKKGTGLGLAICKNIIEAHGGTIGVDSEVGVGSQFWFRLKLS